MSTFTPAQRRFMKRISTLTAQERFLADQKRKKAEEQFEANLGKRQKRHDIRMAKIGAHLKSKKYEGPEFSSSIPDESSTVAALVYRGGFQSPGPSTPQKSATLVQAETPLGKKKVVVALPLSLSAPEPQKRAGKGGEKT